MKIVRGVVGPCAIGGAFGVATSLVNEVSTPADLGGPIASPLWGSIARVASIMLDSGWAWAALAVAVGWLAGAVAWGAVAGAVALLAATAGYDLMDSVFTLASRPAGESHAWSWYSGNLGYWGLASVLLGPILGAVGAIIRRPGVVGLLASLTVPAGALLQMIVLPPAGSDGPVVVLRPEALLARAIVLGAALVAAGLLVTRFAARSRQRPRRGTEAASPQTGRRSLGFSGQLANHRRRDPS
jgi:hypothetical protein